MTDKKQTEIKQVILRLLHPGTGWMLLIILLAIAALIFTFTMDQKQTIFGYLSYVFSAYALVVAVVGGIPAAQKLHAAVYHNPYAHHYLEDAPYRAEVSLYLSLCINLAYSVFQLVAALVYTSFWFGAVAVYYMVLCVGRFLLLMDLRKRERNILREYRIYHLSGILLFALNAALCGMVYQMVRAGQGAKYPGLLIYAVAAYAFYRLTLSIIGAVTYRKLNNPVLSASKMINLMAALVSIFSLQVAMFASFGGGERLQRTMNSAIGGCVCLVIFAMALYMVTHATKRLRQIKANPLQT